MRDKSYIDNIDRAIFPFVEYEGYSDRYPALSALALSKERLSELKHASEILFKVFCKATKVFQKCPDEFMEIMEMPPELRQYLDIPNPMNLPTWLSRFDFVVDKSGNFKMVEINSDTPCAIIESYYGNGIACSFMEQDNPNEGEYDRLKEWLYKIYAHYNKIAYMGEDGHIDLNQRPFLFSCFHDYIEDMGTTQFLMNAMIDSVKNSNELLDNGQNICFESFYDLLVDENGILLPNGQHIGAIYRLHPMELFIDETANDGTNIGQVALEAYKQGKYGMFNPPEALIMQSKAFQALVWGLAHSKKSSFFNGEEIDAIATYMLPSYFSTDYMDHIHDCDKWIKKPIWGREGRGVKVVTNNDEPYIHKELEEPDEIVCRDSEENLYQEFVDQKSFMANTDSGRLQGYITISNFMLGDKPSAVYCRFSPEEIAGTEAYWLPLTLDTCSDI